MNTSTMLHTFFKMSSFNAINDKRRLRATLDCSDALSTGETLTLTGLGRGIKTLKQSIKRVCRLLGNSHLHSDRIAVYRFIAQTLLKNIKHPLIIIDWSPVNRLDKQILRAVIPIGGRAFTIYEEIYPEKQLGTVGAHKNFLNKLASVCLMALHQSYQQMQAIECLGLKKLNQKGGFGLDVYAG